MSDQEPDLRVLQIENAALRAGYNTEDPLTAHLISTYDGDPAGVQQFLTGLGLSVPAATPATTPEPTPAPTLTSERTDLSNNSQPPASQERVRTDPYEAVFLNKRNGLAQGKDGDDLFAEGIAAVLGAAAMGDQRVLVESARLGYADPRA